MSDIELVTDEIPFLLPMANRSPGVHVSSIIHELCVENGHYEVRGEGIDKASRIRMELGNSFEWAFIRRKELDEPGKYIQCGELCKDDIYGTPDLLEYISPTKMHEFKCTWISAKNEPDSDKFWKYWTQLKAYCHMAKVIEGRLHMLFMRGKYDHGDPVLYREWRRVFSPMELAMNWAQLKNKASMMRS